MSSPLSPSVWSLLRPTSSPVPHQSLRVRSYWLRPLLSIRQDDLRTLLGPYPGVYICNCPEQAWFEHFGIPGQDYRATVDKKACMFSHLASGSMWISPTSPVRWGDSIRSWQSPRMLHLGAGLLCGRAAQIVHTLQLVYWLTNKRAKYRYVLMYNFYLPVFLAGVYAKYVLRKVSVCRISRRLHQKTDKPDQESIRVYATQDLLRCNLRERAYGFRV